MNKSFYIGNTVFTLKAPCRIEFHDSLEEFETNYFSKKNCEI